MEEIKHSVLLLDDEEDNLDLLFRTLKNDFEITRTTSPLEALEILRNNNIDVIISDHKMPEMDGVEFLKQSTLISPDTIRLLVTAYSDTNILISAINDGKVFRYIKKPWDPQELLQIVHSATKYHKLKIENNKLIYDLKELFSGTIHAIIEALDAKDSFTLGRSRRVTFISLKIAKHLNLPPEEVSKLELSGLLHDIGMIGISEEILNKTDALNEEEFEKVKAHVDYGIKILEDIKQLHEVVEIIKYHHEKYDGSGYPEGLKGDLIPLNSRIISVADAYDSLVSDRSYREGLSEKDAIDKIKLQSGKQFDPQIVEAFEAVIEEAIVELNKYQEERLN